MPPKRFVFRLETVLTVKLKAEDDAKRKYGDLVQLLAQAERRRDEILHLEAKNRQDLKGRLQDNRGGAGLEPAELQRHIHWGKKLEIDRKKQLELIKELERRVEEARMELIEAMKERKILETLKEQHLEAFNKEIDEEEAKLIDELATLKYARDAGRGDDE